MKTCYSYIRFSSEKQKFGQSYSRQKDLATDWCAKNDGVLDTSLNMEDLGVSAFKLKNLEDAAALGGFLTAVKEGRVAKGSYLLIENFDRLTRAATDDAYQLFRGILKADVHIVTLGDGKVFTKDSLNSFTDIILTIVTMSRAHEEIGRKAELLAKKWQWRRDNIKTRKIATKYPSWLSLSEDYKIFTPVTSAVAIIQKIFEDYCNGTGVVTIASTLNKAGVKCISGRSEIWKTHYIQQLLRSRALIGEYQPHKRGPDGKKLAAGKLETDYYPVVIKPSLFNKVQYLLGQIAPKTASTNRYKLNVFVGKLFCPYCGEKMFIAYQKTGKKLKDGTKKTYNTLQTITCVSAKNGKCINIGWSLPDFEKKFLECSTELQAAFATKNQDKQKTVEAIGVIKTSIEANQKASANFNRAIEMADGEIPEDAIKRIQELQVQRRSLQEQLRQKESELSAINISNPYKNLTKLTDLDDASRARLYQVIHVTIDKIYVFFAGNKFQQAKIVSTVKRLRKAGVNPAKVASMVRRVACTIKDKNSKDKELSIKEIRFFVAHLNTPGNEKRLVYPKFEGAFGDISDDFAPDE